MNAGVSIKPCPVLSRPERAFVLLSVALTSNIGGTLEMIGHPASSESSRLKIHFALARSLLECACARLRLGRFGKGSRFPPDQIADPRRLGWFLPLPAKIYNSGSLNFFDERLSC